MKLHNLNEQLSISRHVRSIRPASASSGPVTGSGTRAR